MMGKTSFVRCQARISNLLYVRPFFIGVESPQTYIATFFPKVNRSNTNYRKLIEAVGLADKLKKYPHELSGGEQQRVSIGRALMNSPSIVLADEPTGNLDSKNSHEIVELLKRMNREYNQTLIMITHDESIALQARRIIAIKDGKIVRDEVISK